VKKQKLGRAYADALFQFAEGHKLVEEIGQQFEWFLEVWNNHELLRDFFLCQALSKEEKKKKLETLFSGYLHPAFLIFLQAVMHRNHGAFLPTIYQQLEELLDNYCNKHRVKIISPFPLDEEYYQQVHSLLTQFSSQNIILTPEINPEILGGFIISSNMFHIDCSINRELKTLRKRFDLISNGGGEKQL
jgi:F-type H+-transporting ATPase subunit delta